jgi:hypothetical protein
MNSRLNSHVPARPRTVRPENWCVGRLDLNKHRIVCETHKEVDHRLVLVVGASTPHRYFSVKLPHHPIVKTEYPLLALKEVLPLYLAPIQEAHVLFILFEPLLPTKKDIDFIGRQRSVPEGGRSSAPLSYS